MTNGNQKGKVGEREVAALLREHGFEARRGQQFAGGGDSPDVVHDIPGVHIEVKRTERFLLWDALAQAGRDAPAGHTPIVLHRMNNRPWVAVLDAKALLALLGKEKAPAATGASSGIIRHRPLSLEPVDQFAPTPPVDKLPRRRVQGGTV